MSQPNNVGRDSDEEDKDWNGWVETQDEGQQTKDLFSEKTFPSPVDCFAFMKKQYGFDFPETRKNLKLDTYNQIKFVNWIRNTFSTPQSGTDVIAKFVSDLPTCARSTPTPWSRDEFLQPVLEEDPLLCYQEEEEEDSWSDDDKKPLFKLETVNPLLTNLQDDEPSAPAEGNTSNTKPTEKVDDGKDEVDDLELAREEEGYFGTYAHYEIHNDMLKDTVRTTSYRDFLYNNPHLIKDKVVMDVGCGTGILSMFAAKVGAKKVIGVDHSDIIKHAQENIEENNLQNVIKLVKSKVELIHDLKKATGEDHVDIIISEWMGYCLLFECMLPSVLIARDRFCGPTGLVFPDIAEMFISTFSSEDYISKRVSFWTDVYGFKMTSIKDKILKDPQVDTLPAGSLISSVQSLKSFDINSVDLNDLDFQTNFSLEVTKENMPVHGFVVYFDIHFSKNCTNKIFFSTGPEAPSTHWHQTLFLLKPPYTHLQKGDKIIGNFKCKRRQHHRDLELHIKYKIVGSGVSEKDVQFIELPFMLL